jgi:7-cyano-7-deazaguanine synthase
VRPAIVLLSGGLDSATTLAVARSEGYSCVALSFRYGQRHAIELDAAAAIARQAGIEQTVVDIDLRAFGGSALTSDIDVPKHDRPDEIDASTVPITYVPARNTIFLSLALALAEVRGADDVFIGVNALDYSGYPDCRPEYLRAFEAMANLATRATTQEQRRLTVHAPLIGDTKAEIIERGTALGVDYSSTISCYDPSPDGLACGGCDSCLLRRKGFSDAGVPDPTRYAEGPC